MQRRDFLKLLLAGVSAEFIDYEKLLWIPGEKKIFLPESLVSWDIETLSYSEIVAVELERVLPKLKSLFERDDTFYAALLHPAQRDFYAKDIQVPLFQVPTVLNTNPFMNKAVIQKMRENLRLKTG